MLALKSAIRFQIIFQMKTLCFNSLNYAIYYTKVLFVKSANKVLFVKSANKVLFIKSANKVLFVKSTTKYLVWWVTPGKQ